jgi:hypothetical protein
MLARFSMTGFGDREILNLILLYRYIISYEPYYFKGRLTGFPLTLAYGSKIDALRRKHKACLWDAEFRDTFGVNVSANGSYRCSVFVTAAGKRAVDLPKSGKLMVASRKSPTPGRQSARCEFPLAPPPS